MKTKGQIQAEISKAVVKIIREATGRGPSDIKTYIVRDLIVVHEKDALTLTEQHLLGNKGVPNFYQYLLVKHFRIMLIKKYQKSFEKAIKKNHGKQDSKLIYGYEH